MTQTRYMLDTNVVSKLTPSECRGRFARERCRIPSDVARESSGLSEAFELTHLVHPTSTAVLLLVQQVMATIQVGDRKLVDLYANKGAADPALIACAIDAMQQSKLTLFEEVWLIVSDDKEVRTKGSEFGVGSMTSHDFLRLLRGDGAPGVVSAS